jgi:hypothetical protein
MMGLDYRKAAAGSLPDSCPSRATPSGWQATMAEPRRPPHPYPPPNPLPQGEGELNAATLLTLTPFSLRRAPQPAAIQARASARGEAGMPKRPPSGQDGLSVDPAAGRGAQGTLSSRFFFCDERAQDHGAALFGYFLALQPKSNSPEGENPRYESREGGAPSGKVSEPVSSFPRRRESSSKRGTPHTYPSP